MQESLAPYKLDILSTHTQKFKQVLLRLHSFCLKKKKKKNQKNTTLTYLLDWVASASQGSSPSLYENQTMPCPQTHGDKSTVSSLTSRQGMAE